MFVVGCFAVERRGSGIEAMSNRIVLMLAKIDDSIPNTFSCSSKNMHAIATRLFIAVEALSCFGLKCSFALYQFR